MSLTRRSSSHSTHKEHTVPSQHHLSSNKHTKGLNPWKLKKVARWTEAYQEEKGRHQKLTRRRRQAGVEPGGEGQAGSKPQLTSKQ
jgi:hypothetical protein